MRQYSMKRTADFIEAGADYTARKPRLIVELAKAVILAAIIFVVVFGLAAI